MSHLLRCDLAWNISFSSHFDDRLLHFGLWGFHAHLLPRMLYQVAIWQLNDFISIFQTRCRHSLQWILLPTSFPFLHKTAIVLLSISQTFSNNFDQCIKPELMWNAWMCQCMNMFQWYFAYITPAFLKAYATYFKWNEQVIQMTYKGKREQRDCQRLGCI